jgi:hypothetical protein
MAKNDEAPMLDDVIAKLSVATGADPALDLEIARSQGAHLKPVEEINPHTDKRGMWMQAIDIGGGSGGWVFVPAYTESIDAALKLVPPQWLARELSFPAGSRMPFAFTMFPPTEHPAWQHGAVQGIGATAPLAICSAALVAQKRAQV